MLCCYMTKKSRQEFKYLLKLLRWNKKHFSSFLKGFQLLKIFSDLIVHLQDAPKLKILVKRERINSVLPYFKETKNFFQCLRVNRSLRKKCPYSELFWSVFPRIRTEYGPNLDRMWENTDQNKSECGHFSRSRFQRCQSSDDNDDVVLL